MRRLLSFEAFSNLAEKQDYRCKICGKKDDGKGKNKEKRTLFIDHDHKTGKIRGLLCQQCNVGLGCFRDNPFSIYNAIKYLAIVR